MSEQIDKTRQTWPTSSPLQHVTRPTDYGDGKPSDVRDIGELPSRLLLGALDRDSFRLSPEGWRAVYRSGIPDTCCGISYDIPAREFTVDWAYRDVICRSGKVQGDAFTDIIKSTTRDAPGRLLAELTRSLEGPLNVLVPQGAAKGCNFVYYPDGILMAVACPVDWTVTLNT